METQEIKAESIARLVNDLWSTVLGLEIGEGPGGGQDHDPGTLTTWIRIIGSLNLVVLLQCPEKLARRVASIMFDVEESQVRPDQVTDSLKELANILGGNIKGMTVKYHFLSMPSVSEPGQEPHFAGGEVVYDASFHCDNQPIKLKVLRME